MTAPEQHPAADQLIAAASGAMSLADAGCPTPGHDPWYDELAQVAVMAALRKLADRIDTEHGAYASIGSGDLRDLADAIEAAR